MSPIVQIPGMEGVGTLGVNGPRVPITKDMAKLFSEYLRLDPTRNFKKARSSGIFTKIFQYLFQLVLNFSKPIITPSGCKG